MRQLYPRWSIAYNIGMPFSTLFFDLDDTLYPSTSGVWEAITVRMNSFMVDVLQIPKEDVPRLRKHYYDTFGTTLRGLQRNHGVDPEQFLAYVHDLPLSQYLQPDPPLRELLKSLPQRKLIFTNADDAHAARVLKVLGLEGCFDAVIDVRRAQWVCKPSPQAYRLAMQIAVESEPSRCVLFEDSIRNLEPARQLGFCTVLVKLSDPGDCGHRWIRSLAELPDKMPELWEK